MTRWEYAVRGFGVYVNPTLQALLDECGADGWELVTVDWDGRDAVFKRPAGGAL